MIFHSWIFTVASLSLILLNDCSWASATSFFEEQKKTVQHCLFFIYTIIMPFFCKNKKMIFQKRYCLQKFNFYCLVFGLQFIIWWRFYNIFLSIKNNFISPLCPQNHTNDIFESYLFHRHHSYSILSNHYSNDQFPYYYPPSALLDLNLTNVGYRINHIFTFNNNITIYSLFS